MVLVRSVSTLTWTDAGSPASICGRIRLTRIHHLMTLAPGWRWTLSSMAGVVLAQLDNLSFSAPSITVATSDRCTGAPFL